MATNASASRTSGVDFNRAIFGSSTSAPTSGANSNSRADLPKAQFWLNVGYVVPVRVQDGDKVVDENRFVSLPVGIPLDTMEPVSTRANSDEYRAFQTARNDLLASIMEKANTLAPGEEALIGDTDGLCIQIRRVKGEAAPVETDSNPFVRKLSF